jgi:hypothetical protein
MRNRDTVWNDTCQPPCSAASLAAQHAKGIITVMSGK